MYFQRTTSKFNEGLNIPVPKGYEVDTQHSNVGRGDIMYHQMRFCSNCKKFNPYPNFTRVLERELEIKIDDVIIDEKGNLGMSNFLPQEIIRIALLSASQRDKKETRLYRLHCLMHESKE